MTGQKAGAVPARRHVLTMVGLSALATFLYWGSLHHRLLYDDTAVLVENASIKSLANVPRFFTPGYWTEERPVWSYRPVLEASLALNWWAALARVAAPDFTVRRDPRRGDWSVARRPPSSPGQRLVCEWLVVLDRQAGPSLIQLGNVRPETPGWSVVQVAAVDPETDRWWVLRTWRLRIVNLLLLAGAAALVYWVAWRLSGRWLAAAAAGAVFALHPAHLEVVCLVKNRSELLAGLLTLVSLVWFLRAAGGGRRWWLFFLGCLLAMLLGLGAKETAIVTPAVVTAAALVLPGAALGGGHGGRRRALALAAPLWALAAAFVLFLFLAIPGRYALARTPSQGGMFDAAALSPSQRALLVLRTVGLYVIMLVWPFAPNPDRLVQAPVGWWQPAVVAALAATAAAAVVLIVLLARRKRVAAFALLWMLLALAPVSNLVVNATRPVAEQRAFQASIPLAVLGGLAAAALAAMFRARRAVRRLAAWVVGLGLAAGFVGMTVTVLRTVPRWRDEERFWAYAASVSPDHYRVLYNYGIVLHRLGKDHYAESEACFRRVITLTRANPWAEFYLGLILLQTGRADEGWTHWERAVAQDPTGEVKRHIRDRWRDAGLPGTLPAFLHDDT